MEKYLNGVALLFVAAGLFTLSYVIYLQADRGRWLPALHEPGASVVVDSYSGRVWHIEHDGDVVSSVKVFDMTEGELKKFKGKK